MGRVPAMRSGPIADLPVVVVAPAVDVAVGLERAGVHVATFDGSDVLEALDEDRHVAGRIGAVTEVSIVVASPAANPCVGAEGAGVVEAARDLHEIEVANVLTLIDLVVAQLAVAVLVHAGVHDHAASRADAAPGSSSHTNERRGARRVTKILRIIDLSPVQHAVAVIIEPAVDP